MRSSGMDRRDGPRGRLRLLCVAATTTLLFVSGSTTALQASPGPAAPPSPNQPLTRWGLEDGLPQSTVSAIVQDSEGYIWLGTEAGLVRFDGFEMRTFDRANTPELRSDHISELLLDDEGILWIGTRNGLSRYRNHHFQVVTVRPGPSNTVVESMTLDSEGRLWVGTRSGLACLRGGSQAPLPEAELLDGSAVFSLASDAEGALWIGTAQGLWRYKGGSLERPDGLEELQTLLIIALERVADGSLWIGTAGGGLFRLDPRTLDLDKQVSFQPEIVLSLLEDSRGRLWVGSRGGLETLEPSSGRLQRHEVWDTVFSLFEDRQAGLWVGTRQQGVYRVPGIPEPSPPMVIESIRLASRPSAENDPYAEPPKGRADLEVFYTVIDFDSRESLRFRTFLEGYDDTWSKPVAQRYASFTNLSPGNYRFRVRLADRPLSGLSSEASVTFTVEPLWYQTRSFRIAAFLAGALLLAALYQLRIRRLLRTQSTLKTMLEAHTEEIQEQKEEIRTSSRRLERANRLLKRTNLDLTNRSREKADFLAIATHDLRAPLVNLKGFTAELELAFQRVDERLERNLANLSDNSQKLAREALKEDLPEYINFIHSSAKRIEQLIEPILRISRINRRSLQFRPVSLIDLVENAVALRQEDLSASGIRCEIGSLESLLADETVMEETLQHLLSHSLNALEGRKDGRIEIHSRRTDSETIIAFHHNGRPVAEDQGARFFRMLGQSNSEEDGSLDVDMAYARALVQRLGGRIWIRSKLDRTSIYFSIPKNPGKAHS